MALTSAQALILKAAINANPTWAAYPVNDDGYIDLAVILNKLVVPTFWVWSTNVDVQKVRRAITWANLTPADTPDGTQQWANRSLQCQGKQFNLQLMIPPTGELNASDITLRGGIQDALQGINSGVAGIAQGAGWSKVQLTLSRPATEGEKIFADIALGNGLTQATPANLTYEGAFSPPDIALARTSV